MLNQKHQQTWDSGCICNCIFHIIPTWSCRWQAFQMTLVLHGCVGQYLPVYVWVLHHFWQWWKSPTRFKRVSLFLPHKNMPSNLLMKRSVFIFKIILTMLKYKKNLQNHVHSKAFKKTLSWEIEPQPSFHDYYYYCKILALLHITGILKNCHLE